MGFTERDELEELKADNERQVASLKKDIDEEAARLPEGSDRDEFIKIGEQMIGQMDAVFKSMIAMGEISLKYPKEEENGPGTKENENRPG